MYLPCGRPRAFPSDCLCRQIAPPFHFSALHYEDVTGEKNSKGKKLNHSRNIKTCMLKILFVSVSLLYVRWTEMARESLPKKASVGDRLFIECYYLGCSSKSSELSPHINVPAFLESCAFACSFSFSCSTWDCAPGFSVSGFARRGKRLWWLSPLVREAFQRTSLYFSHPTAVFQLYEKWVSCKMPYVLNFLSPFPLFCRLPRWRKRLPSNQRSNGEDIPPTKSRTQGSATSSRRTKLATKVGSTIVGSSASLVAGRVFEPESYNDYEYDYNYEK